MNETRSFASLGPTLLARKGAARPAMRPHPSLAGFERDAARPIDDLGWNDMGEGRQGEGEQEERRAAELLRLKPAPDDANAPEGPAELPEVRRQQDDIARRFAAQAEPPRRSALEEGRRAAFTLRLDAERHLRLRLVCTIRNRSAQQLVTEALDRLLADMPELETLAAQVKRK